ncbi:MAG: hypothetical protein IJN34_09045 [Clostridia bacterium]|nr:hypothetical protein [Clostridia bacterium]
MKTKTCLIGALSIGLAAGVTRILQYIFTIGPKGFYLHTPLADVLSIVLTALLAVGVIWCLIYGFSGSKEEACYSVLFRTKTKFNFFFFTVGLQSLVGCVIGIRNYLDTKSPLQLIVATLCLLGGIAWLIIDRKTVKGARVGLIAVLPVVHLGAVIIDYFWQTYKYIHVSAFTLALLGLCTCILLVLAVMKAAVGGACTLRRLGASAGLVLVFAFAGFWVPLFGEIFIENSMAENSYLFTLGMYLSGLAAQTLSSIVCHPQKQEEQPTEPDLSHLNEFLSNLPEIEEE